MPDFLPVVEHLEIVSLLEQIKSEPKYRSRIFSRLHDIETNEITNLVQKCIAHLWTEFQRFRYLHTLENYDAYMSIDQQAWDDAVKKSLPSLYNNLRSTPTAANGNELGPVYHRALEVLRAACETARERQRDLPPTHQQRQCPFATSSGPGSSMGPHRSNTGDPHDGGSTHLGLGSAMSTQWRP